jgi:hypothetical protein
MPKATILILILLTLLTGSVGLCGHSVELRQKVETTYLKEVGVREATGKNDGVQVEAYLKSVNLGKGYPWCAAYVIWVYKQCGINTSTASAWSPSLLPRSKVIYQAGRPPTGIPQPGDVFGIYFNNLKRVGHVGFVHRWQDLNGYVRTVEGNTNEAGSREGDGVYMKRRLKRQIYAVANWISANTYNTKYSLQQAVTAEHTDLRQYIC